MRLKYTLAATALIGTPAAAADLDLTIEIPRLTVAEYHRPYVAIWIEEPKGKFAGNLAVWYDLKLKDNEGTKWLKDMRQWWRKSGRDLDMPVDGLSSATRAPGEQKVSFNSQVAALKALPPGDYQLIVEAAREVGGRELLRLPFQWPPQAAQSASAKGERELGAIKLDVRP